jgi:2',3'-cyclic-nucleotide 2'-phosphodiesterase (5'-nucleotidase family)
MRYGPASVTAHARASSYPQLLANFTGIDATVPSVLLGGVGILGLTDPFDRITGDVEWGFGRVEILETARALARELRAKGATLVVLLSHLGYEHEWIGRVLVAQAGCDGDHIGRVEIDGAHMPASVEPVPPDTPPDPRVLEEAARIEDEIDEFLREQLGVLEEPLDARAIAEILRRRADADVGLFSEGQTLAVVPAGPVTRGALWEASESGANPGGTRMRGEQLLELLDRGNDPLVRGETPRALRGRPRGRLEVVGAELEPGREYVVAGTDWELEPYGGYALEAWNLQATYEFPTIVREAIEDHLRRS